MTTTAPTASGATAAAAQTSSLTPEAQIEQQRSAVRRPVRAAIQFGATALVFAAVAAVLAELSPGPSLFPLLVCAALYAVASRVQFEVATGFALPTQIALVPAWVLVPPGYLPALAAAGMILGRSPELVRRRMPASRLLVLIGGSWHAVGPALVLLAAGTSGPRWSDIPFYAAALAAQFAFDFVGALPGVVAMRVRPATLFKMMAPAFAVDASLAPLGLLIAFPAAAHPAALLLAVPCVGLIAFFARERQRRVDHALELSHAYRGTAMLLGDVVEADDAYTGSHSRDVVELVLAVSERLGLPASQRQNAEFTALLHDVGKVKIPPEIINKPGPLDDDEWTVMRTHTIAGEEMLEKVGGLLGQVGRLVRSCHERWDGGGYPDRLSGEEIPLIARIVCCCDAFNAMTTDRSYHKALPLHEAVAEIRRCSGTQFDPQVVSALFAVVS